MGYVLIQTNVGAPATLVSDLGVTIPGTGGNETFTELAWLRRIQTSNRLRALCTDNAYGANASTLELYDLGGQKVLQGLLEVFLSQVHEDIPGKMARGAGANFDYIYVGRTLTPGAIISDPVWQITRFDVRLKIRTTAGGAGAYSYIWDATGGVGTPTYETHSFT